MHLPLLGIGLRWEPTRALQRRCGIWGARPTGGVPSCPGRCRQSQCGKSRGALTTGPCLTGEGDALTKGEVLHWVVESARRCRDADVGVARTSPTRALFLNQYIGGLHRGLNLTKETKQEGYAVRPAPAPAPTTPRFFARLDEPMSLHRQAQPHLLQCIAEISCSQEVFCCQSLHMWYTVQ